MVLRISSTHASYRGGDAERRAFNAITILTIISSEGRAYDPGGSTGGSGSVRIENCSPTGPPDR